MLRQKQNEIAIPVGEPVNLCEKLFAILLWDDRKQGLRANLGGVALGIDGDDIHDGDRGLVLQYGPRMGGSLLDEGTALSQERVEGNTGSLIQSWVHACCHLLELGLGIRVVRQKAEEQVTHPPVARQHLLMG